MTMTYNIVTAAQIVKIVNEEITNTFFFKCAFDSHLRRQAVMNNPFSFIHTVSFRLLLKLITGINSE